MKNFTIFISLAFFLTASSHAKLAKECLVDYLKFRNVNDEAFESIEPFSGDPGTCSADVKAKVEQNYGIARSKLESHIKKKPYADCAMREVEGEKYANLLLTAEVIELKGVGIKFWKISTKNSRIEQLQAEAQAIVDDAIIKCKGQIDYGNFYDSFYEQKRHDSLTNELDYCMRKHLVDQGLMSSNVYNFKVNPNNVRTGTIDCAAIMELTKVQMKESITSAGSPCVINAFIDNGYLDLIMKIQLLSKLTLTPTENEAEKQKFVNAMVIMTHQIKACPMQN